MFTANLYLDKRVSSAVLRRIMFSDGEIITNVLYLNL